MFEISFALSLTETGYPRRKARSRRSAFARFTRYSASDIAPAIATAVAPSREKIFWTTFDPTKNPFEARLSAARTTPSLLRMPTVVVMLNLGPLCGRSGKLTRMDQGWSPRGRRGSVPVERLSWPPSEGGVTAVHGHRRAVRGREGRRDKARVRSHVDDVPAPPTNHRRQGVLRAQERPFEVDVEDRIPISFRHLLRRFLKVNPGVVHKHVDGSERPRRSGNEPLRIGRLRHVAPDSQDLAVRTQRLNGTVESGGVSACGCDRGAFVEECLRGREADSRRTAGDEDDTSFETRHRPGIGPTDLSFVGAKKSGRDSRQLAPASPGSAGGGRGAPALVPRSAFEEISRDTWWNNS